MAKDESRTILLVLLIGGLLFMITRKDEEDKVKTEEKRIEAVVNKKVDTMKEAEELIKTNKEQQDEGWWLKLFRVCQSGIPVWYRNIQQLEHNRVRSLDRDTTTVVIKWVATIQFLVATISDYFPQSNMSVRAQQMRKQVAELFQMVEYMRNYNVRNQREPPGRRDQPGPPGAHKPSSDDDKKKKEANQNIRDKFAANKRPDKQDEKTDMEIDSAKRAEGESIQDDFATNKSKSDELVKHLEGNDEGEDPSTTTNPAASGFVQGGGTGKTDVEDGGAKERTSANNTTDPASGQAPGKVNPPPIKPKPTQNQFDSAPSRVGTDDAPPAPTKPRRPRAQTMPTQGTKRTAEDDDIRDIRTAFNASNDTVIGEPQPSEGQVTEDSVQKTGDLRDRFKTANVKQALANIRNRKDAYDKETHKITREAENFIDLHPKPMPSLQKQARRIKNEMWNWIPPGLKELFYAAFYPDRYGQSFTRGAISAIKNNYFYQIWSKRYEMVKLTLDTYTRTHVPDLNATDLAESVGRQGKRNRPGRVRGSRSRSMSVSEMKRSKRGDG